MASMFAYAAAHAGRFRRGRPSNTINWQSEGDTLAFCAVPLLRRDGEGQFSIRWPGDLILTQAGPPTVRGMLNALLKGLELRHAYCVSVDRSDRARFMAKIHGKWRDQYMVPGEWMTLVDGDLARLAVYAERRAARQEIIKRDVDHLASLSFKRGNKNA